MRTVLIPLPPGIGGFVMEDPEGYHTICLNANHTRERNRETYAHELSHIQHGDLSDGVSVDEAEVKRHE